jgi:hypothetical protein
MDRQSSKALKFGGGMKAAMDFSRSSDGGGIAKQIIELTGKGSRSRRVRNRSTFTRFADLADPDKQSMAKDGGSRLRLSGAFSFGSGLNRKAGSTAPHATSDLTRNSFTKLTFLSGQVNEVRAAQ